MKCYSTVRYLGIPLPMAVRPIMYILATAMLLESTWLLSATVALRMGPHTVIWIHFRGIK